MPIFGPRSSTMSNYNSERSEAFWPSVARVYGQLGNRSVQKKNTSNHQPTNQKKIHDLPSCFPKIQSVFEIFYFRVFIRFLPFHLIFSKFSYFLWPSTARTSRSQYVKGHKRQHKALFTIFHEKISSLMPTFCKKRPFSKNHDALLPIF